MTTHSNKALVIGAGFAGLSAASFLAKKGWAVTIVEKNEMAGGRARKFEAEGFTFDMGPSWYWMPDVFEKYFGSFGKKVSDFYEIQRLDPSYRVYFEKATWDLPANYEALKNLFESIEPGAANALDLFLAEAKYKYEVGVGKLVYQPSLSITEFIDFELIKGVFKLDVFQSMKTHIARYFKHPYIQFLMEFPVLFLGALPENTPALYSLMNYADIKGGTWYPQHGMYSIVEAMVKVAKSLGVQFKLGEEVMQIVVENGIATKVISKVNETGMQEDYSFDVLIGAGDYHHIETKLLEKKYQSYSAKYWDSRVLAPSSLLYYVGLNKKLKGVTHHSLFFDSDFSVHGSEIYSNPMWPSNPLFYASVPSVTDPTVAPVGCENLFLLIPIAAGLEGDTADVREKYFNLIIERLEKKWGQTITDAIVYKRSYAVADFKNDYHSFKGNAYGLANTLLQTAFLKPSCKSKKINNLYYTGQLTVPGPGVPPSLISGEVVANLICKQYNKL
ncbi:MAG: phytoene desaturase family protein [Bacteroidetes bacterium]|jgi:phytoene desaturase|nr:phytoene desaturase family protein [Bacteroidota bacterium]